MKLLKEEEEEDLGEEKNIPTILYVNDMKPKELMEY